MMFSDYVAQGVGLLASALIITAFSHKSDDRFKLIMAVGASTFALHYFLMGAYAGMAVAIINAIRIMCSIKFHNSNKLLYGFLTVYLLVGILIYEKPLDILPLLSSSLGTYAIFKLSGIKLRAAFFMTEIGWTVYSIFIKSLGGLITNIFVLSANAITIYRLLKDKKK